MIPISEKSSGGALVDWVPEGHDRKYTEPAAMSIRIAAAPSAWAFDFARLIGREPNSSSGCLSGLGPLRAGRRANPPPVPSERRLLVGGTDSSNLLPSSGESANSRSPSRCGDRTGCARAEAYQPERASADTGECRLRTACIPMASRETGTPERRAGVWLFFQDCQSAAFGKMRHTAISATEKKCSRIQLGTFAAAAVQPIGRCG
jgi:hypothetical protein